VIKVLISHLDANIIKANRTWLLKQGVKSAKYHPHTGSINQEIKNICKIYVNVEIWEKSAENLSYSCFYKALVTVWKN